MSWNYRVVKYRDGSGYGLHEVFYDDEGKAYAMTERPVGFACDPEEGPLSIALQLLKAHEDASELDIFDEPAEGGWPGKAP